MSTAAPFQTRPRKLGVVIGGSGLIGGTLMHYFKTRGERFDVLAPNSKRLSLREPEDVRRYFKRFRPDFLVNAAVAAIDSDPQLAFETNYLGTVYLARAAAELKIPYIHFSTAAVLPPGRDLTEEDRLPLSPSLANYPKSKLMAEQTLEQLGRERGLDYTIIRLAIVYGTHDHKIQGFQRLLFAMADQAMPVLFTSRGAMHSYSNASKLPWLVDHLLTHRREFSGQIFHFVDPNPVALSQLILTIKSYLELRWPKEFYLPYPVARAGLGCMARVVKGLARLGIEARQPAELVFLGKFYQDQTLSAAKLAKTSFQDPDPDATVFTALPSLIQYYLTRWEHLNLIGTFDQELFDLKRQAELFVEAPEKILEHVHQESRRPFLVEPTEQSRQPPAGTA